MQFFVASLLALFVANAAALPAAPAVTPAPAAAEPVIGEIHVTRFTYKDASGNPVTRTVTFTQPSGAITRTLGPITIPV